MDIIVKFSSVDKRREAILAYVAGIMDHMEPVSVTVLEETPDDKPKVEKGVRRDESESGLQVRDGLGGQDDSSRLSRTAGQDPRKDEGQVRNSEKRSTRPVQRRR